MDTWSQRAQVRANQELGKSRINEIGDAPEDHGPQIADNTQNATEMVADDSILGITNNNTKKAKEKAPRQFQSVIERPKSQNDNKNVNINVKNNKYKAVNQSMRFPNTYAAGPRPHPVIEKGGRLSHGIPHGIPSNHQIENHQYGYQQHHKQHHGQQHVQEHGQQYTQQHAYRTHSNQYHGMNMNQYGNAQNINGLNVS